MRNETLVMTENLMFEGSKHNPATAKKIANILFSKFLERYPFYEFEYRPAFNNEMSGTYEFFVGGSTPAPAKELNAFLLGMLTVLKMTPSEMLRLGG